MIPTPVGPAGADQPPEPPRSERPASGVAVAGILAAVVGVALLVRAFAGPDTPPARPDDALPAPGSSDPTRPDEPAPSPGPVPEAGSTRSRASRTPLISPLVLPPGSAAASVVPWREGLLAVAAGPEEATAAPDGAAAFRSPLLALTSVDGRAWSPVDTSTWPVSDRGFVHWASDGSHLILVDEVRGDPGFDDRAAGTARRVLTTPVLYRSDDLVGWRAVPLRLPARFDPPRVIQRDVQVTGVAVGPRGWMVMAESYTWFELPEPLLGELLPGHPPVAMSYSDAGLVIDVYPFDDPLAETPVETRVHPWDELGVSPAAVRAHLPSAVPTTIVWTGDLDPASEPASTILDGFGRDPVVTASAFLALTGAHDPGPPDPAGPPPPGRITVSGDGATWTVAADSPASVSALRRVAGGRGHGPGSLRAGSEVSIVVLADDGGSGPSVRRADLTGTADTLASPGGLSWEPIALSDLPDDARLEAVPGSAPGAVVWATFDHEPWQLLFASVDGRSWRRAAPVTGWPERAVVLDDGSPAGTLLVRVLGRWQLVPYASETTGGG